VSNGAASSLLDVRGLRTWFPIREGVFRRVKGHVRAVDGVDLSIGKGETLALVGESGCGKTTVGRSILRLIEVNEGSVHFEGRDILKMTSNEFRPLRSDMQIVMQDPASALDPRMSVQDSIAEGLDAFAMAKDPITRTKRIAALMARVALDPDTLPRFPHELSGGQRQRVCIARALAVEPKLIICDEAVSALDVSIQAQILNLLNDLQAADGLAYLFITHDLGVVRYFADRVAVMYLGRIVEQGRTEQIFNAPRHPYTKALLASVPSIDPDSRGGSPEALGDVPSPANPPTGCHYHPRCKEAMDICPIQDPPVVTFEDGMTRCWLSETTERSD
jgi:peptide/nickel transport system ATP-binding protein